MAAAPSGFRSVSEDDLDVILVEAIPEKTKTATKYEMKIFHSHFSIKSPLFVSGSSE